MRIAALAPRCPLKRGKPSSGAVTKIDLNDFLTEDFGDKTRVKKAMLTHFFHAL